MGGVTGYGLVGALLQAVAATAGGALVVAAEPVHHVAGVPAVAAAQAEVGGSTDGHVADSALEAHPPARLTLCAQRRAAAVAAEHPELCSRQEGTRHRG